MATDYFTSGSNKGRPIIAPEYKPGQLVIYVGKHPDFAEEKRIGSVGIVKEDERWTTGRNNIEVEWFKGINPTQTSGGCFQENIALLEEGWEPPAV